MTRTSNSVLFSGVLDPFISDQIRYHCPVILLLKFTWPSVRSYTRKIWNYSRTDFDKYRELTTEFHLENAVEQSDVENGVQIVQAAIFEAAEKSTPNKTVIIRPNDHPWITRRIKSLIRKRKCLYETLKSQTTSITRSSLRQQEIQLLILLDFPRKLETTLNGEKPSSKLFWNTSKQILKLNKSTQSVPTLIYNNETAETDLEKANMPNNYSQPSL